MPDYNFEVSISYVEIYNENIKDLLLRKVSIKPNRIIFT